jgi:hypothetical protein
MQLQHCARKAATGKPNCHTLTATLAGGCTGIAAADVHDPAALTSTARAVSPAHTWNIQHLPAAPTLEQPKHRPPAQT